MASLALCGGGHGCRWKIDGRGPVIEPVQTDTVEFFRTARKMTAKDQALTLALNPYRWNSRLKMMFILNRKGRLGKGLAVAECWHLCTRKVRGGRMMSEDLPEPSMLIFPPPLAFKEADKKKLASIEAVCCLLDGTEGNQGFCRFERQLGRQGKNLRFLNIFTNSVAI